MLVVEQTVAVTESQQCEVTELQHFVIAISAAAKLAAAAADFVVAQLAVDENFPAAAASMILAAVASSSVTAAAEVDQQIAKQLDQHLPASHLSPFLRLHLAEQLP